MKTILFAAAAVLLAGSAAVAQEGGPPPGGGPPPEVMKLFQDVRTACADDMKTLCGDKQGREQFMCLRQNQDKASQPCKDALSKLPPPRPPQ
jgi:hypothetical protein